MNLNSDAVQNVKGQRLNFESGVVKGVGDGVGILSPDISFSGIVGYIEAGATIALLDFVGFGITENALALSDASDATLPCSAIALEAGDDGDVIKVLLYGYLKAADLLFGVQASAVLTCAANITDNDTVTIGGITYEFTVDGTVTEGNTAIEDAAIETKANVTPALTVAVNLNTATTGITAVDTSAFVCTVTATGIDVAATGNAVIATETAAQLAWTDTGGVFVGGTNGGRIFLSDTSGDFGLSAGTVEQVIGQALSLREMLFNPGLISI